MLGGVSAKGDRTEVRRVRKNIQRSNIFVEGLKICSTESDTLEVWKTEGGP